jgi:hypothetical protein
LALPGQVHAGRVGSGLDARIALDCRALVDGTVAVGDEVRFDPV